MKKIKKKESVTRLVIWVDHEAWTDDDTDEAGQLVEQDQTDLDLRHYAVSQYGQYSAVRHYQYPAGHGDRDGCEPSALMVDLPGTTSDQYIQSVLRDVLAAITPLVVDRCQIQPGEEDVIRYEVWRSIGHGAVAPLGVLDRMAAIPTDEPTS